MSKHAHVGTALLGALLATAAVGCQPTVTRDAYLQDATPTSTVVRWRTNAASDSVVRYGASPSTLTSQVSDPTQTTEHEITLTGLTANTTYYYSIGTSTATLAGGTADYNLITQPPAGQAQPMRIWVLGDPGTGTGQQQAVRDAFYTYTGTQDPDFWLMLGDNAYSSGTDTEFQLKLFNQYPTMLRKRSLWLTLGNHDGGSADSATQTGPYYDNFTLPKSGEAGGVPSGTEAYYSFDYGNIHFICLDSYETDRSPTGAMMTWMQTDLAATSADWTIAFWHHPPYSKGSHNSDTEGALIDMRQNFLPVLESYGVDLVLAGHSHSYERSYLLDGHYGSSSTLTPSMILDGGDGRTDGTGAYTKHGLGPMPHLGAVYAVPGSSGQTSGGSLNHPAMFVSLNVLGSMVLDVDGDRLDAAFVNSLGDVQDHFTIQKVPS